MKKLFAFNPIFLTFLFVLGYVYLFSPTAFFFSVRHRVSDNLFQLQLKYPWMNPHFSEVVVVGLDDESMTKINYAWPVGRSVFAEFLDNLQSMKPKVVAFDIVFAGRSHEAIQDSILAESLKKKKNVILASFFDRGKNYVRPLPLFEKEALGSGFISKPVDRDGKVRVGRLYDTDPATGEKVLSFAARTACAYKGLKPEDCIRLTVAEGDLLPINYQYNLSNVQYVPFWMVAHNVAPRNMIEGKIVLVGGIAPILHDTQDSPLGPLPGTLINANELFMILGNHYLKEIPFEKEKIPLLILAVILALVFSRCAFPMRLFLFISLEALSYLAHLYLFFQKGIILEPFSAMFIVASAFIINLIHGALTLLAKNLSLQKIAITDALTGLYGPGYLAARLEDEFNKHLRLKNDFCFVMIDIDFFKKVNDSYGHAQGNNVLVGLAKILKSGVRKYDVAARYGGEEFSLIIFADEKVAFQTLERIRKSVETSSFVIPGGQFQVTISAGIASSHLPEIESKEDLIRLADAALYKAKNEGRNRVCVSGTT